MSGDDKGNENDKKHNAKDDFILRSYQSLAIASIVFAAWGLEKPNLSGFGNASYWGVWLVFFASFIRVSIGAFSIYKYLFALNSPGEKTIPDPLSKFKLLLRTIYNKNHQTRSVDEYLWRDLRNVHPRWYFMALFCFFLLVSIRLIFVS